MKLGDNMAPIEACNVWSDVCPRKARPPKIGDIPRPVAVDEESPGSSTSRSVFQVQEAAGKTSQKSMLVRSTRRHNEHGIPGPASGTLPALETFAKPPSNAARKVEQVARIPGDLGAERAECLERPSIANPSISRGKNLNGTRESSNEIFTTGNLGKKGCGEAFESIIRTDEKFDDDGITEEIIKSRKDSALYIDEEDNDVAELRDRLVAIGVGPRSAAAVGHQHNAEDVVLSSRVSVTRPRRESSGYFSNLGTFDEDRWGCCTVDHPGNQQDATLSTRESFRERRRSSTKNRLPMGGGQQANRMTTIVCPTSDDTAMSPSDNDVDSVGKTVRVDMPNIDEQSSLELNKSVEIDPCTEIKFADVKPDAGNDMLAPISRENSSSTARESTSLPNDSTAIDSEGIRSDSADSGSSSMTTARTAHRQRNRIVVHQYSSPSTTNMELEKIVERPHSESSDRSANDFNRLENYGETEISDESCEEDDNDHVVTANLGGSGESRKDEADAKKFLPKSIKVYQLLSTQSEDRADGDARLFDRRISLQIPRPEEPDVMRENACGNALPSPCKALSSEYSEEKKLIHADSVPIIKIPSSNATGVESESRLCAHNRLPGSENMSGPAIPGIRPIYPYCPYSPYASPQGSPRTNRRRPLRESRRVSIDSRQGALQLNQYKLLNNIGQGSYGIVKLAYNEEDETHYAMKILSKKKLMKKAGIFGRIAPRRKGVTDPLAKVYREIALLKKLDHPNVVKLVEVLDDPDEDNLYLVFELVQRGEVLQLPTDKPLDEETARRHFRDVVMGVEYLHYQRIVHRDIKPSNLLVDGEGRVKVADLGVSAELRAAGELLTGSAGTPAFAAPETTSPGAQYSGTPCDVWSMGVTLYSLVTGKVPWDGAGSIIAVQSAVRSESLRFPETPCLTVDLRDLISRMLSKDPTRRINMAEIKEHPWLTRRGEEPLPGEADNCRLPVTVTDEEVARVVTRVPKLDTLILIKTMLKQHSFQNPFLSRRIGRSGCTSSDAGVSGASLKQQTSSDTTDSSTELLPTTETLEMKTEQFHKAGRSNSAPDSYEWQINGKQISSDSLLPPVTEFAGQEQPEVEKR